MERVQVGGPLDGEARTCGVGGSGARGSHPGGPPHSGRSWGWRAGRRPGGQAWGTKLQEAGPRLGPGARHTKRGLRPGHPGPAHKGSGARAASGLRRGPGAPRLPGFQEAGAEGAGEDAAVSKRYRPGIATAFLPPLPSLPSPS